MGVNLGIVTSCRGYGCYLGDWAASIIAQTVPPAFVGILTHGSGGDAGFARAAARSLRAARIPVTHRHLPAAVDFGSARNAAVALAQTDWVMHLDADDALMPHALQDVAGLAGRADVVALGYVRTGDLAAGPSLRRKLYRASQGRGTLENPTPCSGVSPFRRSLWERAPYRTDLTGGWDTALWLGFAHLGARIVPTLRPCFWYRMHADSLFNVRRQTGWAAHRAGSRLQSLRVGEAGVAVLVPRDPDGGPRDAVWAWLQGWYREHFPAWDIRVGCSPADAWRKGEAIERALDGCRAEVVVVADADCVPSPAALEEAVARVRAGVPWVVPHGLVHRLSAEQSQAFMARGVVPPGELDRKPYTGFAGGGCLVVGRSDYEATGGIPRAFVGWGAEDEALARILDTLLGPHERLPDDLIHLWHPPAANGRGGAAYRANRALWQRFVRAEGDAERMWALVQGRSIHHLGSYTDPVVRHRTTAMRAQAFRDEVTQMAVHDSFAERRLAQQHLRETTMGTPLDLKREHLRAKREQRERNEAAYRTRGGPQLDVRKGSVIGSTKAVLTPPANKMLDGKATANKGPVKFASTQAQAAAAEADLDEQELQELAATAGKNGITLAQVKEYLDEGDADEDAEK